MIVCTTCGTHNIGDDEFCVRCGGFLAWVGEHVADAEPDDNEAEGETEGGGREEDTRGQLDELGVRGDPTGSAMQERGPKPRLLRLPDPIERGGGVCARCGMGNDARRRFCRRCGSSLVDVAVARPRPWWKRLLRRHHKALKVRATNAEALEAQNAVQARAMDAEALVARLLSQPGYLSELEAVVGPIHMSFRPEDGENTGFAFRPPLGQDGEFSPLIPHLSIEYFHDRHHGDPTRPRDVKLIEYTLHLRGDRAAVERVLLARYGQPRQVAKPLQHTTGGVSTTNYAAYHPFYVANSALGDFMLSWFAAVPRFAIPEPDAEIRRAWLADLCAQLESAHSVDDIDAFCRAAPASVGIEIGGTLNHRLNPVADFNFPLPDARDYWISFAPPVGAHLLIEAFGWAPAVGVSYDVHMSSWHIERRGARRRPISGALQHWEIDAHLAKWPSGPPDPGAEPGPSRPYGIGDADEVTGLAIGPRFR